MTRIKICGITNPDDARAAADAGADAIGMVFWPGSPRAVTPGNAARIVAALPPFVGAVGVFVDETIEVIRRVVELAGLTGVQLHGDEPLEVWTAVPGTVIKSVAVGPGFLPSSLRTWPACVTPLLDVHDPDRRGGTGRRVDWTLAAAAAHVRPVILAGGMTPAIVGEAVRDVRPAAVDVSSGVEHSPGRKDVERMRAFVRAVRAADESGAS